MMLIWGEINGVGLRQIGTTGKSPRPSASDSAERNVQAFKGYGFKGEGFKGEGFKGDGFKGHRLKQGRMKLAVQGRVLMGSSLIVAACSMSAPTPIATKLCSTAKMTQCAPDRTIGPSTTDRPG